MTVLGIVLMSVKVSMVVLVIVRVRLTVCMTVLGTVLMSVKVSMIILVTVWVSSTVCMISKGYCGLLFTIRQRAW